MEEEVTTTDVRQIIMNKMDREGRTLQWLSNETGINYNTLHSCIKRLLFSLSQENLEKINKALGTTYEQA